MYKLCCETPFENIFGAPTPAKASARGNLRRRSSANASPTTPLIVDPPPSAVSVGLDSGAEKFCPRSEAEIEALVKEWTPYAHPRAREFFTSPQSMQEALRLIAMGIDRLQDPVLGSDKECVHWFGEVASDGVTSGKPQPAIHVVKPGDEQPTVTYVTRILAFIFSTDESFDKLMRLPKEPFCMECGNELCIHLSHIAVGEPL
eukprot:TRINITY_DN37376_c0_g1_i1.p1 TRINITY_DN37376_c0_g1~~TRINITY_DN37376_c0_g1_i1.p1  ORF type:complete len:203 (-),score=29.02 TRINITY_DN37376_c0_g1_i1:523-1131(-)